MEERGMVIKIKRKSCIVVTPDGEFKEVPLPSGGLSGIGPEITLKKKRKLPYLRHFMVAASMLLVFFLAGRFYSGYAPEAAAYMTIDINPSIELAVSNDGKVVSGYGLNSDGRKIMSEVKVKGLDLPEAVELIIAQAITDQYLSPAGDNVILATITVEDGADTPVDLESVYGAIKGSMDSGGLDAEVIVKPVKPEVRREAEKNGISTGRFLLLQKSVENSLQVSVSELKTMRLGELEKDKKVSLVRLLDDDEDDEKADSGKEEDNKFEKRGIYIERNNSKIKNMDKPDTGLDEENGIPSNIKKDKDNSKINVPEYDSKKEDESEKGRQHGNKSEKNKDDFNNNSGFNDGDRSRNGRR